MTDLAKGILKALTAAGGEPLAAYARDLIFLAELEPVERARRAAQLVDEGKAALAAVRTMALQQALRDGWTQAQIAAELDLSRAAISKIVNR